MNVVKLLLAACICTLSSAAHAEPPRPFTKGSLQAILTAQAGTPTIVHFWGLTCGPCRVDMPEWAALLDAHPQATFVTVDTDEVPDPRDAADRLWRSAGVTHRIAWRFENAMPEQLFFDVDRSWQGEVPMTLLVGRDGHIDTFTGALDPSRVEHWLAAQDAK